MYFFKCVLICTDLHLFCFGLTIEIVYLRHTCRFSHFPQTVHKSIFMKNKYCLINCFLKLFRIMPQTLNTGAKYHENRWRIKGTLFPAKIMKCCGFANISANRSSHALRGATAAGPATRATRSGGGSASRHGSLAVGVMPRRQEPLLRREEE